MKKLIIAVILLMALATTAQSQPTYIGADGKSVYTDANQSYLPPQACACGNYRYCGRI
ncbi:MAG: hypothetical protein WCK96_10825 [Methylococcales bacterium]